MGLTVYYVLVDKLIYFYRLSPAFQPFNPNKHQVFSTFAHFKEIQSKIKEILPVLTLILRVFKEKAFFKGNIPVVKVCLCKKGL